MRSNRWLAAGKSQPTAKRETKNGKTRAMTVALTYKVRSVRAHRLSGEIHNFLYLISELFRPVCKTKYIPVLLYGLEAWPLNKTQTQSLDFVINRLFMKLYNTSDIVLVKQCQGQFNFRLPSVALERRRTKFMHKLCCVDFCTWSGRSIGLRSLHYWRCIAIVFFLLFSVRLLFLLYFTTIRGE